MRAGEVAAVLGGAAVFQKVIDSDFGRAREVEAGLPAVCLTFVMQWLQHSTLEQAAVDSVVGGSTTLQRERSSPARLSREESDRLARLVRLVIRTDEALGSRDKALRWLTTPNLVLTGSVLLQMLSSESGAFAIEQVLGRIEHGVTS